MDLKTLHYQIEELEKDKHADNATNRQIISDNNEDEVFLLPLAYINKNPGKNVRSKIAKAFNYWLQVPEEKLAIIEDIVQTMHNDSLLIDDIQDNSLLRRGNPVAHAIYGVPIALNAGLLSATFVTEKVLSLNNAEAVYVYSHQVQELIKGQGMEIYWRDNFVCPSEEEYSFMVIRKTGSLFMMIVKLMQIFSENKENFSKFIGLLGLIFQIVDDYQNLISDAYMLTKSYCEDLTEGKFSFPLVHAIKTHPEDGEILDILRQRTNDIEIKKRCVYLLEKYGSFEYTKSKLRELINETLQELKKFGDNPYMHVVVTYFFKDVSEILK